jgi:hypothetical protein
MSQTTSQDKAASITAVAPPASEQTEVAEQKKSFFAKTKHFVVRHKKPAIAAGALVALVGVAAVTGRKTAPLPDFSQPQELTDGSENESVQPETESDTNVA